MPAYNLDESIADNIRRVAGVCRELKPSQIVVIDDGSTDHTRERAEEAAALLPNVTVVGYDLNRGKGAALKEGCRHAEGDTIVFLDSDLDIPPEQLPAFLTTFDESQADVIVGAKRRSMTVGRYPALRKVLSLVFSMVNRILFRLPISETQTGLKAFRRQLLWPAIDELETTGYAFDIELLVHIHKRGGTLSEAPVTLSEGSAGSVTVSNLAAMARDTLSIWWRSLRRE